MMGSRSTPRFRVWYTLLLAAVIVGISLLDLAIAREDRPVAFMLVLAGVAFFVVLGSVQIVRVLRRP